MKIEHDAWVVIADGRKALIARNTGALFAPKLEVHSVLEAPANPPTHEQGTDRPGRAHESSSARRSGMEQTDWHAQAEAAFLGKVGEARSEKLCRKERWTAWSWWRRRARLRACGRPCRPQSGKGRWRRSTRTSPSTRSSQVEKILADL